MTSRPKSGARRARLALLVVAFTILGLSQSAVAQPTPDSASLTPTAIDRFDSGLADWSAHPSEGVDLKISEDTGLHGRAMRLDFDFGGHAGYAIARRRVDLLLPPNYELTWRMRAEAPVNNLELKLIDATGDNVWWTNRRDFDFPHEWKEIVTRKRQIGFAWGPRGGGEIGRVAALEIVVTAGSGGKGTVWIDDLMLEPLPPEETKPVSFSGWRKADGDASSTVDFGRVREIGGVRIDWDAADFARDFSVEASRDGQRFEVVREVKNSSGGGQLLWLPEVDARSLRITMRRSSRGSGWAARGIEVEPPSWAPTINDYFGRLAEHSLRGDYPRYLAGQQPYWTIVGSDRGEDEALAGEDGNVEPFKRGFSIEPFVQVGNQLFTWADARIEHSLERDDLPIVTSTWTVGNNFHERASERRTSPLYHGGKPTRAQHGQARWVRGLSVAVTSFVAQASPSSERGGGAAAVPDTLYIRYRVTSPKKTNATLYLAVRPFQVNPTAQFLNTPGGASLIRDVAWDGSALVVNGSARVVPLTTPGGVKASTFDEGNIVQLLRRGEAGATSAARANAARLASREPSLKLFTLHDDFGYASASFEYPLALEADKPADIVLAVPLSTSVARRRLLPFEQALKAATAEWARKLDRVSIDIPAAPAVANTLRSNIAYILINADGPRLQPGSRSYERSWIRDGALIASVLLRLGHAEIARQFAAWYAPYQFPDGKVPCCVDARGADPVPENDSDGELIFLVAEIWRFTHDEAFVRAMWPRVDGAARHMQKLRGENHGEFEGLLTESISHEGYSAKPMHSYWDDFFGVRGLTDAADLARVLKMTERERELREQASSFRRDLSASIARSMQSHGIDFVPGSAELGDFDATSTAIAVSPLELTSIVPNDALTRTFDRYLREFRARRDGAAKWDVYTPYELRNVGAFVRLGRRAQANELLDFFMADRRPLGWNEWAEVVPREMRAPHFLGDTPHSWVGSDFMRSLLDFFAFDRDDGALVVGAGIPEKWVNGSSVHAGPLATYSGSIDVRMRGESERVTIELAGTAHPSAGIVVTSPYERTPKRALVNGAVARSVTDVRVATLPARVVFEY